MALRERSYRNGDYIWTYLHNSNVRAHKEKQANKLERKRIKRQRDRQERADAKDAQRLDAVAARLRDAGVDTRWANEALAIMEQYGYGLGQIRTKVLPILKPRIKLLLLKEQKQKAASNELSEASSRLFYAASLQVEALRREIGRLGKDATVGHVSRYLSGMNEAIISVEVPSGVGRRLLTSFTVGTLLLCILFLATVTAFGLLPERYRSVGLMVGIAILLVGSIRIIRKRYAIFLRETAPQLQLSNDVMRSILTRLLSDSAIQVINASKKDDRFDLFHNLSRSVKADKFLSKIENSQLLKNDLYKLPRFRRVAAQSSESKSDEDLNKSVASYIGEKSIIEGADGKQE